MDNELRLADASAQLTIEYTDGPLASTPSARSMLNDAQQ
jgi:hypothetical protein